MQQKSIRRAKVKVHDKDAGFLEEVEPGRSYRFLYATHYKGPPVSLTMPVRKNPYEYSGFPSFFDGLLPEGMMLEALLRQRKIDRQDYYSQLIAVGHDLVGAITIEAL